MNKNKMCDAIFDSDNVCAMPNENIYDVKELGVIKYLEEMKKQNENKTTTNNTINVSGDNKGFISQDSDFSNSPIKIKTTAIPTNTPDKKSLGLKTWELISNNKLITGLIFLILEESTLGGLINLFKTIFN